MRNAFGVSDVLSRCYLENSAVIVGLPGSSQVIPALLERVRPVHEIVEVGCFLQGCPPSANEIYQLVMDLVSGHETRTEGAEVSVIDSYNRRTEI